MKQYIIYSDGGARGNPGPGAYGFVIKSQKPISNFQFPISNEIQISNDKKEIKGSQYLGEVTNNQAEYQGILNALKCLKLHVTRYTLHDYEVTCYLDSKLIVEQMNGNYKVKNEGLKPLYCEIGNLVMGLGGNVRFEHIPREKNCEADALVNAAIDKTVK